MNVRRCFRDAILTGQKIGSYAQKIVFTSPSQKITHSQSEPDLHEPQRNEESQPLCKERRKSTFASKSISASRCKIPTRSSVEQQAVDHDQTSKLARYSAR